MPGKWSNVFKALKNLLPGSFNWIGFAVSCIVFGLTLFGDHVAFSPAGDYIRNPFYIIVKFFTLLFLVSVMQVGIYLLRGCRRKHSLARRFCQYFGICFALTLLIWLLTFPGIVGTDEANVLYAARHLDITISWFHVLTIFFYSISLAIFPSWGTVTLMEVFFVCVVAAYIVASVHMRYGSRRAWVMLAFLFLPQMLANSVTPHRISLSACAELLLIFLVWCYCHHQDSRYRRKELVVIGALTGIVASWRTEGIIYLFAIPLAVWLFGVHRTVRPKHLAELVCIIAVVYVPISMLQNLNTGLMRQYQVTGLFAPLSSILRGNGYTARDKTRVKRVVDKAIDYNQLVAGEDANTVYWARNDRSIGATDLAALKRTTLQLIFENPGQYIRGAFENYISSGLAFEGESSKIVPLIDQRFSKGLIASSPLNTTIRMESIRLLKGLDLSGQHTTPAYGIFYANPLVGAALLCMEVFMLVRRRPEAIIFLMVIAKNGIVFLTMPMASAYYLYPLVAVGGVLMILTALSAQEDRLWLRTTKEELITG